MTAALVALPLAAVTTAAPDHATGQERAQEQRADQANQNAADREQMKAEGSGASENDGASAAEMKGDNRSEQGTENAQDPQNKTEPEAKDEAPANDSTTPAASQSTGKPESTPPANDQPASQSSNNNGSSNDAAQTAGDDPPGNNGTVKIDGIPFDDHPDNEPHPGCEFQVDFYGYDEGDLTATYRFDLHAPTGDMMLREGSLDIGEDPAGGGTDLDASVTVNLAEELAASGIDPHPQQGYHVRLTVHAEGSIGADVKHKMFWVECETDVGGGGEGPTPPGGGEGEGPTDVGGVQDERDDRTEVLGVQFERDVEAQGFLATTGASIAGAMMLGSATLASGLLLRGFARRRR